MPSSATQDAVVRVAEIALGGSIVQAIVAFLRRSGEARQLDRETDSIAVDTAEKTILLVRSQLEQETNHVTELEGELSDRIREVRRLADQIVKLRAELSVLRAERATSSGSHS